MATNQPYGIVEDPSVSIALADAIALDARVEDVYNALTWRLARSPKDGDVVEHDGATQRLAISRPIKEAGNPVVCVRYTLNEGIGQIVIHWAKVYPYDESTAYSPDEFGDS
jgi:hypothetical protein